MREFVIKTYLIQNQIYLCCVQLSQIDKFDMAILNHSFYHRQGNRDIYAFIKNFVQIERKSTGSWRGRTVFCRYD